MHNLALPVETVIQNVFDSVSIDALCNILAKQALEVNTWLRIYHVIHMSTICSDWPGFVFATFLASPIYGYGFTVATVNYSSGIWARDATASRRF